MFEKDDYRKRMDQVVKRIKGNPQLAAQFREEPIKTIEEVLGVSLPDEQVRAMAADIREKIGDRGASEIFTDEERPREGSFIDGLRDNA